MKIVPLTSVATIVSGGTPKSGVRENWGGTIPWVTPKDLSDQSLPTIRGGSRSITERGLATSSAQLLPRGSVLLSTRAPIGLVAINEVPLATNQGFKNLVPDESALDARYLAHWLRASTEMLQSLGVGATFKELSKNIVARLQIPLPDLAEQRRIADILDLGVHMESASERAHALLFEAESALFYEFFGAPHTMHHRYASYNLGELLVDTQYGTSAKASPAGEVPLLRMGNLTYTGRIDIDDLKYVDEAVANKYDLRPGDLLFNRTNSPELVGKTALFEETIRMSFAGYLIRLRTSDGLDPQFLTSWFNMPDTKTVLRSMCKSIVGMANINAQEVRAMPIAVPPLPEQRAFVEKLRAFRSHERKHRLRTSALAELQQSLATRAFKGEL